MPNGHGQRDHAEVVPAAHGCAVLVSAAACGMVLVVLLLVVVILLFIAPAVGRSLEDTGSTTPELTAFILSIPSWLTLLAAGLIAAFAIAKELAISHGLANFIINLLLLLLVTGFGVVAVIALTLPYVVDGSPPAPLP